MPHPLGIDPARLQRLWQRLFGPEVVGAGKALGRGAGAAAQYWTGGEMTPTPTLVGSPPVGGFAAVQPAAAPAAPRGGAAVGQVQDAAVRSLDERIRQTLGVNPYQAQLQQVPMRGAELQPPTAQLDSLTGLMPGQAITGQPQRGYDWMQWLQKEMVPSVIAGARAGAEDEDFPFGAGFEAAEGRGLGLERLSQQRRMFEEGLQGQRFERQMAEQQAESSEFWKRATMAFKMAGLEEEARQADLNYRRALEVEGIRGEYGLAGIERRGQYGALPGQRQGGFTIGPGQTRFEPRPEGGFGAVASMPPTDLQGQDLWDTFQDITAPTYSRAIAALRLAEMGALDLNEIEDDELADAILAISQRMQR